MGVFRISAFLGILDRYLLKAFLRVLVVCLLSFTGLYIVIDLFGNLDDFIASGERSGGLAPVILEYYGARGLAFVDRAAPVAALIAALFVLTWMQRTNQLTAVEAAGVPRARIVRPLLIAVIGVSLLGAANREFGIPRLRDPLSRNAREWLGDAPRAVVPRYDNETEILFNGRSTIAKDRQIVDPILSLPPSLGAFGRQIQAETATWRAADGDRPSGYLLRGVREPSAIDGLASGRIGDRPVVLTRADAPWLEPGTCLVASGIDFEQFAAGDAWRRFSSSSDLIRAMRNPSLDYGADVRVTVHARMVQPLLDVLLFVVGTPLVFTRRNRNVFVASGLCLLAVVLFFIFVIACHALGANYLLRPALAAWCPVFVMAPLASWMSAPLWE
ncbi:MAG: LptF/LptG family permease [Planctomycetes bacterium]|nr:LptF/LptG family permease [Planctomycetota bacterium]